MTRGRKQKYGCKTYVIGIRVPEDVLEWVDRATNNRSEFVVDLLRKYKDGRVVHAAGDSRGANSTDTDDVIDKLSMLLGCSPTADVVVYHVKKIVDTLPLYGEAVAVRDHLKKGKRWDAARSNEIVEVAKKLIPNCDWDKANRIYGIMKQFGLVKVVHVKHTTHGTVEVVEIV